MPLRLEEAGGTSDETAAILDPQRQAGRDANRAFWQRFIDTVRFDHPDQPLPRHGGNNWVKIPLPAPARWLTAYRSSDEAGLFLSLDGEEGRAAYDALQASADALCQETGLDLTFEAPQAEPFKATLSVKRAMADLAGEEDQRAWFAAAANRLVSALRPRLG